MTISDPFLGPGSQNREEMHRALRIYQSAGMQSCLICSLFLLVNQELGFWDGLSTYSNNESLTVSRTFLNRCSFLPAPLFHLHVAVSTWPEPTMS